jgi:hypothetical protein
MSPCLTASSIPSRVADLTTDGGELEDESAAAVDGVLKKYRRHRLLMVRRVEMRATSGQ